MSKLFKWITLNLPQIVLICGFFVLSIGSYFIGLPVGLIVSGVSMIILSILMIKSD
ncbi:hypothetical protein NV391_06885 [Companilactobacillus crustorum]|uniref:hypothetical protein n=1 Tax=Companilactobacillus crustorum TaxID=392416 RepID=UPI00237DFF24|nr:hypothetical protein [Companilactobacillus crustorum]WDT64719.1 hypothetical protein NV391_06885 [Companilactobacillus crustorum]